MPSLYLEKSVISYLTARPARDLITAARQQVTRDWWTDHRFRFTLYASQVVIGEAAAGDPTASGAAPCPIERACRVAGYRPPVICTPDELMGGS